MVFTNNPIITMILHMPIMVNETKRSSPIIYCYSSASLSPLVTSLCLASLTKGVDSIPSIPAPAGVKGDGGRGAVCQLIATGGEIAGIVIPIAIAYISPSDTVSTHG